MAEYELGQFYRVPAILIGNVGWWRYEGWLAVVGPMHEDAEIVNFPWSHFHVDWRFAPTRLWKQFKDYPRPGSHFGWPVQSPDKAGTQIITQGPELRRLKCKRDPGAFPVNITKWQAPLREKFACAKLINGLCPSPWHSSLCDAPRRRYSYLPGSRPEVARDHGRGCSNSGESVG